MEVGGGHAPGTEGGAPLGLLGGGGLNPKGLNRGFVGVGACAPPTGMPLVTGTA
jgi:hypothetical protein